MDGRIDGLDKRRTAELLGGEDLAQVRPLAVLGDDLGGTAAAGDHGHPPGKFFKARVAEIDGRNEIAGPRIDHLLQRGQGVFRMGLVVDIEHVGPVDQAGGAGHELGQLLAKPRQLLQGPADPAGNFHVADPRLDEGLRSPDDIELVLVEDEDEAVPQEGGDDGLDVHVHSYSDKRTQGT